MSTEVAEKLPALEHSTGVTNPHTLIYAMVERGVDPDKIGKMIDHAQRWEENRAAQGFADALTGFQAECPAVKKSNPVKDRSGKVMYKFASFDDVMDVAKPYLAKHKIVPSFSLRSVEHGQLEIRCRIRVGIHFEDSFVTASAPAIQNANDTQRAGGAITYLKRYALCNALNIVVEGEDNDAVGCTAQQFASSKDVEAINTAWDKAIEAGCSLNFDKLLEWFKVESLEQLPKDKVKLVLTDLELKRRKAAEQKAGK